MPREAGDRRPRARARRISPVELTRWTGRNASDVSTFHHANGIHGQ